MFLHRSLSSSRHLVAQLAEIEDRLAQAPATISLRAERVSAWSIGQQFDHILKVLEFGDRALREARDPLPRGIKPMGRVVLALGWFPRGVAKSPQRVLPGEATQEDLLTRVALLRQRYSDPALPPAIDRVEGPVFPHPFFGGLTARQGLRFLVVHTRHHLRIVADIRRAAATP